MLRQGGMEVVVSCHVIIPVPEQDKDEIFKVNTSVIAKVRHLVGDDFGCGFISL